MKPDAKIFVAGHRGLVGGAILRRLKKAGFTNLLDRSLRATGPGTRLPSPARCAGSSR